MQQQRASGVGQVLREGLVPSARGLLENLVRQLAESDEAARAIPDASPRGGWTRLCIGLATYDDFDGAYFTIQAIRLAHPEILGDRWSDLRCCIIVSRCLRCRRPKRKVRKTNC